MADAIPVQTSVETVRKWHALAERRRKYFVELYRSDRWRRYYSEEAFLTQMRDVIESCEVWTKVLENSHGAPASSARA